MTTINSSLIGFKLAGSQTSEIVYVDEKCLADRTKFEWHDPTHAVSDNERGGYFAILTRTIYPGTHLEGDTTTTIERTRDYCVIKEEVVDGKRVITLDSKGVISSQRILNVVLRILEANYKNPNQMPEALENLQLEAIDLNDLFDVGDFCILPSVMGFAIKKARENFVPNLFNLQKMEITDPAFKTTWMNYENQEEGKIRDLIIFDEAHPWSYYALLEAFGVKAEAKHKLYLDQGLIDFWEKVQDRAPFNTFQNLPVFQQNASLSERAAAIRNCFADNSGLIQGIRQLDLSRCALDYLPPEIDQFTTLDTLFLYENKLRELPAEICGLTGLQDLFLTNNELRELPAEIGKLTGLQQLSLRDNELRELPAEIGKLTGLRGLHLEKNELRELPAEIGKLTGLEWLHLDKNELRELPAEIGKLTGLQGLYLDKNELRELPAAIGKLTGLFELNLDDNMLMLISDKILTSSTEAFRENPTLADYRLPPRFLMATEIESLHSVSIEEHAEKNSILIRELVNIGKEFYKGKTTIALEAFDNLFANAPESSSLYGIREFIYSKLWEACGSPTQETHPNLSSDLFHDEGRSSAQKAEAIAAVVKEMVHKPR